MMDRPDINHPPPHIEGGLAGSPAGLTEAVTHLCTPLPPPTPLAPPLSIFSSASYSRPQPSGLFLFVAAVPCPDFCFLGGDREEPPVLSGLLGKGRTRRQGRMVMMGRVVFLFVASGTHTKKRPMFFVSGSVKALVQLCHWLVCKPTLSNHKV